MEVRFTRVAVAVVSVSIVLVGRLLYLCDSKNDRPSIVNLEAERRSEARRYAEKQVNSMARDYAREQNERRQREMIQQKLFEAQQLQIRQEEFQRMKAREIYRSLRGGGLIP